MPAMAMSCLNPYIGKNSGRFCGTVKRYHKAWPLSRGEFGKMRKNSVNRAGKGARGPVLGRKALHKTGVDRKTGFPRLFLWRAVHSGGRQKPPPAQRRDGGEAACRAGNYFSFQARSFRNSSSSSFSGVVSLSIWTNSMSIIRAQSRSMSADTS